MLLRLCAFLVDMGGCVAGGKFCARGVVVWNAFGWNAGQDFCCCVPARLFCMAVVLRVGSFMCAGRVTEWVLSASWADFVAASLRVFI